MIKQKIRVVGEWLYDRYYLMRKLQIVGAYRKKYKNHYLQHKEKLMIVCTAPSSDCFWNDNLLRTGICNSCDIMLVNDLIFQMKEIVFQIKPAFYITVDPRSFNEEFPEKDDNLRTKIRRNSEYQLFNQVDWPMTVIVPDFMQNVETIIDNNNIRLFHINSQVYNNTFYTRRFEAYDKNKLIPNMDSVGHAALYFGLMYGYKDIGIIGNDNDFWRELRTDCDNRAYYSVPHAYYEVNDTTRYYLENSRFYDKRAGAISGFLKYIASEYAGYMYIREYADYKGAKITNYATGSSIEAFTKKDIYDDYNRKREDA